MPGPPARPVDLLLWPGRAIHGSPIAPPFAANHDPTPRFTMVYRVDFSKGHCGQMTCASWSCCPSFCSLRNCRAERFWFMIANQGRRSEGKQPVSLPKYGRILSMPTGWCCAVLPTYTMPISTYQNIPTGYPPPVNAGALGAPWKILSEGIYKCRYTQITNILNCLIYQICIFFPIQIPFFSRLTPKGHPSFLQAAHCSAYLPLPQIAQVITRASPPVCGWPNLPSYQRKSNIQYPFIVCDVCRWVSYIFRLKLHAY